MRISGWSSDVCSSDLSRLEITASSLPKAFGFRNAAAIASDVMAWVCSDRGRKSEPFFLSGASPSRMAVFEVADNPAWLSLTVNLQLAIPLTRLPPNPSSHRQLAVLSLALSLSLRRSNYALTASL